MNATLTDVGRKALEAMKKDTQTAAGARAIIRRTMRSDGVDVPSRSAKDAEMLATWAIQHPEKMGPAVAAAFERAAQQWTEGNNSGNPRTLEIMDSKCDETRRQAALVCALFGIERVDYPGLYPTFVRGGRTWYSEDEVRALKGE